MSIRRSHGPRGPLAEPLGADDDPSARDRSGRRARLAGRCDRVLRSQANRRPQAGLQGAALAYRRHRKRSDHRRAAAALDHAQERSAGVRGADSRNQRHRLSPELWTSTAVPDQ